MRSSSLRRDPQKETFIGEPLTPEDVSFSVSPMAMGKPGLPRRFSWKGGSFSVLEVLEEWKECGNCRHGSGERYVRKHWFRLRTTENLEMTIYFERQGRSSGGSRWRLYTVRYTESGAAPNSSPATPVGSVSLSLRASAPPRPTPPPGRNTEPPEPEGG